MENSDYKNNNEAASGLVGKAKKVGRFLMSPREEWNNLSWRARDDIKDRAKYVGLPALAIGAVIGLVTVGHNNLAEKREAAILQEMDKIQYEQVVDDGYGQYGATEMSAEVKADIRATAEKIIAGDAVKKNITELCLDDVVYYLYKDGVGKTANSALSPKIDSDTLMPERCEVTSPKM